MAGTHYPVKRDTSDLLSHPDQGLTEADRQVEIADRDSGGSAIAYANIFCGAWALADGQIEPAFQTIGFQSGEFTPSDDISGFGPPGTWYSAVDVEGPGLFEVALNGYMRFRPGSNLTAPGSGSPFWMTLVAHENFGAGLGVAINDIQFSQQRILVPISPLLVGGAYVFTFTHTLRYYVENAALATLSIAFEPDPVFYEEDWTPWAGVLTDNPEGSAWLNVHKIGG